MSFFSVEFVLFFFAVFLLSIPLRTAPRFYRWYLLSVSMIYLASWGLPSFAVYCGLAISFSVALFYRSRILTAALSVLALGVAFQSKILGNAVYFESVPENAIVVVGAAFIGLQLYSFLRELPEKREAVPWRIIDLLYYIFYFPKILLGPIESWKRFQKEILATPLSFELFSEAAYLIALGMFKKLVIASRLAEYTSTLRPSFSPETIVQSYGAFFQVYCDFSARIDILSACSLLLGHRLSQNFRLPFLANSPSDFWRRWHITFWVWIRDNIFFPVIGRTRNAALAIMAAFLFSGLWHGGGFLMFLSYSLWGVAIVAEQFYSRHERSGLPEPLKVLLQFHLSCFLVLLAFWGAHAGNPIPASSLPGAPILPVLGLIAAIAALVAIECLQFYRRSLAARIGFTAALIFLSGVFFKAESYIFYYIRI